MKHASVDGWLLASDLDGTLIPYGGVPCAAAARFGAWVSSTPDVCLAYVTGRHLALALDGVARASLPSPRFLACDVGTSVYERTTDGWRLDDVYRGSMRTALAGADGAVVADRLDGLQGVEPQPADRQAEFKRSFYFAGDLPEDVVERRVAERLRGVPVHLVLSRDASGRGLLDVLPEGISKVNAVAHLAARLALPSERVLYAGDSGNDLTALVAGWHAVLVGNATDAVREVVCAEAARRGVTSRLHLAASDHAAGVLEAAEGVGLFSTP